MNPQRNLFLSSLLIFLVIVGEISSERKMIQIDDKETAPLALIIKKADNSLSLAIPETYDKWYQKIGYFYDDSEEELVIACPIPPNDMTEEQKKWLEEETVSIKSDVLSTARTSDEKNMNCGVEAVPSIRQTTTECGLSKRGKFYEFGYPISIPNATGIIFVSLHKLCFSPDKGTIYSTHRIESPNLQLKRAIEYKIFSHIVSYTTKMDEELEGRMNSREEMQDSYAHDFVGLDFPIYQWFCTTEFILNYTSITRNAALFEGMTKFDNFIRLFSKRMQMKLTLYTGTYEFLLPNIHPPKGKNREELPVQVKLFWKIIMDPGKRAVIMVTQHAPTQCYNEESICLAGSSLLDTYDNYGCTYLCPVNEEMLKLLDLPPMEISEQLELKFTSTSSQKVVQISDFKGNTPFLNTLKMVDSALHKEVMKLW